MMISRIQSKIHTDMVNPGSVTFIRIEEDEISDADLREVFDLNFCIADDHDTGGGSIYFKGAAWYRALGLLRFQTERNRVRIIVFWQVTAVTPDHTDKP